MGIKDKKSAKRNICWVGQLRFSLVKFKNFFMSYNQNFCLTIRTWRYKKSVISRYLNFFVWQSFRRMLKAPPVNPRVYTYSVLLTQSKMYTIIARCMCVISLIVFTDNYLGHIRTFYTKGISLHFNYLQIHNNKNNIFSELKNIFRVYVEFLSLYIYLCRPFFLF